MKKKNNNKLFGFILSRFINICIQVKNLKLIYLFIFKINILSGS